ncbi:MAG: MFS transporter [Myxococcales bacterium]|nr:MFS transporter [Myxococcales bacterium]
MNAPVAAPPSGAPISASRAATLLRVYYVAVFAALGVFVPFFPSWLEARGIRGWELGLVTGVIPLASFFGPLAFGYIADRYALRAAIIRVACGGAVLCIGVLGLMGGLGLPVSLVTVLLLIAAFAFFRSPLVMVADVSAMETPSNYGRLRLWGSLGFMAMALIAGQLLEVKSATGLPLFVGLSLFAAFLTAWFMPARAARPAGPVYDGVKELLSARRFRLFLLVTFFWFASHSGYDLVIGRHLRDLGGTGSHVGIAWGIGVTAEIVLMAFSAPLFRRYSAGALFSVALFGTMLRWLLLAAAPSLGLALVLQPLHAISFGLTWLSALAVIQEQAPQSARATAQGAFSTASALGGSSGALLWGTLYEAQGGRAVFLVAAGIALLGALTTLRLVGLMRGAREAA